MRWMGAARRKSFARAVTERNASTPGTAARTARTHARQRVVARPSQRYWRLQGGVCESLGRSETGFCSFLLSPSEAGKMKRDSRVFMIEYGSNGPTILVAIASVWEIGRLQQRWEEVGG